MRDVLIHLSGVSYPYLIPVTDAYKSRSSIFPLNLVGCWRLRGFNASSPISLGTTMYNKRQNGADNGGKEPLASNQVVGGSNPSGRAILSKTHDTSENCIRPQITNPPTKKNVNALEKENADVIF